jgi:capsule polysaccharide export protein KpsE/RkpR
MIAIISLVFCILYFVFFPSYIYQSSTGAQVSQKKTENFKISSAAASSSASHHITDIYFCEKEDGFKKPY